jgi:thiol-disulfide isomerase/thioredoxin
MTKTRRTRAGTSANRRRAAAEQRRLDARWLIGGATLVIAVAAIAAVLLTRPAASDAGAAVSTVPSASEPAVPVGSGVALPLFASTSGDPAIGRLIPEATGASFDGSPVAIKSDGRPKLLLFLAHWCPHCQKEVPVVQAWLDDRRLPPGIDLISIATSTSPNRPNYPPSDWLRREGWSAPVLVDADDSIATRFGLKAFPYWVVVGADGKVSSRLTGELTSEQLDVLAASVAP